VRRVFEERCLRHREFGRTRHPQTGAAEQPWLLLGNLLKIQWLAASHLSRAPRRNFGSRMGTCSFYGVNSMPSLRTKSISTKVTDEEYAQFEASAGEQNDQRMGARCFAESNQAQRK